LRNRKSDLTEDEYFDQLQSLMLELATIQRAIDEPAQTQSQTSVQPSEQKLNNGDSQVPTTDEVMPGVD